MGGKGGSIRLSIWTSLLLLNFVVNYLLLLASARLAGELIRRPRLAAGAAVGAVYAAAVFFPGMGFLLHPLCKLGAGVLMLLPAFGHSRRLLRIALVFFGVSAAFGGGILAIELLGGHGLALRGGVFYSAMDLRLILLSAAGWLWAAHAGFPGSGPPYRETGRGGAGGAHPGEAAGCPPGIGGHGQYADRSGHQPTCDGGRGGKACPASFRRERRRDLRRCGIR